MQSNSVISVILLCGAVGMSQACWAALGGSLDTVQADEAHMRATRQNASRPGYGVHELFLPSGTVVREFTTSSNTVFAVTWQGPFKPDLRQLLGEHFERLVAAGQRPHGDHRSLKVHESDLVIESAGRMRSFTGRAYLPALVPAGVSIGDIR